MICFPSLSDPSARLVYEVVKERAGMSNKSCWKDASSKTYLFFFVMLALGGELLPTVWVSARLLQGISRGVCHAAMFEKSVQSHLWLLSYTVFKMMAMVPPLPLH